MKNETGAWVIKIFAGPERIGKLVPVGKLTDAISLRHMQMLVGGDVETVPTIIDAEDYGAEGEVMLLVDDEGKLRSRESNPAAADAIDFFDDIRGDVVLALAKGEEIFGFPKDSAQRIFDDWDLRTEEDLYD